ncbi:TPA: restriction endonuclease subunit S [Raoultella ornithinolytica]
MGSKWATVSIDDIKSPEKYSCVGGPFGSSLSQKHYVDSGVPVIRGTNLAGDIFSESGFVFVSPDKANELQRNMAFRGDIVFTQRGTLGQVALIPEDSIYERYIVSQSQMKLTVNPKQADAYFIYTYFRTNEAKALIENNAIVGGVPHINLGILKEFKLRLPPLSEQKRISEVSKSIDNKINLNRQINQTLEQISQTLFKSWFVDFDPVIDNALDAGNPIPEALQSRAELRQKVRNSADFKPLPADIRALFPAEFEETELGWLPKDWYHKNAEEIATISIGKTPPRNQKECFSHKKDSNYTWVSIKDLGNCNVFIKESSEYLTTDAVNNYNVKIVPKGAVLLSFKLTIGRIAIAESILTTNEAIAHFYNMKHGVNKEYLYSYLQHFDYNTLGSTSSIATAVNSKIIRKIPILLPDTDILHQYKISTDIIFKRISFNNRNTYDLTALRDTLLPKLISGELSLEDLPDLVTQTEPA